MCDKVAHADMAAGPARELTEEEKLDLLVKPLFQLRDEAFRSNRKLDALLWLRHHVMPRALPAGTADRIRELMT